MASCVKIAPPPTGVAAIGTPAFMLEFE
jgi:hypothetical protein